MMHIRVAHHPIILLRMHQISSSACLGRKVAGTNRIQVIGHGYSWLILCACAWTISPQGVPAIMDLVHYYAVQRTAK